MRDKVKQYITSVLIHVFTVVNIIGLPPLLVNSVNPSSYVLYASSSDAGSVIVKIKGEHIAPDRITDLVATPRLVSGFYPGEELGGRVDLVWTAPKDPEVYDVHPDTYVFSYIIKYDTSTRGYDLGYLDQLWQWWDDAQKVFSNHIWQLPLQAQGQTFELYPLGFGIPAPEEKYRLTYGITDKIIVTGLPKGEKIWIGVSSRDRYYNQSTPTVVETYVPAGVEPPSKVTDLYATYGGSSTVQLSWTSPANDRFSIDASSGLYNIPDGRYCIAYSTVLPQTLDFSPKDISTKWPEAQVLYIDTSTLCFVPQVYKITGLSLIEVSTSVGYYFLLWTSDEWFNKTNWSKGSNLAVYGLVAPNYVRNINVTALASTDPQKGSYVILSWVNPEEEDIPLDGVKIYYSTRDYTTQENYFVKYTTTPNELVTTEHYQLLPRHWYYYILLSYNMAGSRPWISDVIRKIYVEPDLIPPDAVTNLTGLASASEQDGVYISLTWTLPDPVPYKNKDYYIDGRIEVYYSTTSFTDEGQNLKVYPNATNNVTLTGLIAYTTYYISVVTSDGGNNKSTATICIYTPVDPYAPSPPDVPKQYIYVGASDDENIGSSVTFRIINPPDLDLKEVRVYYSTTGYTGERMFVRTDITTPGATYYFSIKQLIPRLTYYFEFVSIDQTGRSSQRVLRDAYIDKDILSPGVPSNVQLIADAKPESPPYGSYVKLSFTLPDLNKYRNFDLVGYEIYASSSVSPPYVDTNAVKITLDRNVTYCELLNLEQHTTYYVTIHSFDPVGNKSTSTIFEVFTWKDIIPPLPAVVKLSTVTVSLDPDEGVKVKLSLKFSSDKDITRSELELSPDENFAVIQSSIMLTNLYPNAVKECTLVQLDPEKYYVRTKVYDWSGNVNVSTITFAVDIAKDNTVPLSVLGLKCSVNQDKLVLQWNKVKHHYNTIDNKIEKFVGVNNRGSDYPTTFELYKYKILYKQNLFNDTEPWCEVARVISRNTSCELPYNKGFYKVVSYDICGNSDESLIIDDESNYYLLRNNVYVKFVSANVDETTSMYYTVQNYPQEEKGRILKVISVNSGLLDETQGRINYVDTYRFKNDNYVGIRYTIADGKVRFASINKSLEVNPDIIEKQVAFYVYDGKEYIRATTYVDKDNRIVYFKTKYLTKVQLRRVDSTGEFRFAEVKPKVITPDSSPGENDIVFFIFNNPRSSEVKIRIYDVNSVLVYELTTREDSSTPGSYIGWDGKNFDGKYVPPGVYIYQVEAEGKKYKGTIVVAR